MKSFTIALKFAALAGITLCPGAALRAETFTIAVVPDTQNYTDILDAQPRGIDTLSQQMQYIVDTRAQKNLVFVTFVGDLVQRGDGHFRTRIPNSPTPQYRYWDTRGEWDNANHAVSILTQASIPLSVVPGNHDYDNQSHWWEGEFVDWNGHYLAGLRTWDYYFGPDSPHFKDKPWYGGSFRHGGNSYQFFTGGGKRFLHLGLQMNPGEADLQWAQGVIDANPGLPVIISTHEWLLAAADKDGGRDNTGIAIFDPHEHLKPDDVWDRFVRKNSRIFLILCGHQDAEPHNGVSQGENLRIDRNDAGYPVYQVLQDFQDNTVGADGKAGSANGGAGWMRFIEFDTKKNKIHFYTYSTLLNKYAGKAGENTFGSYPNYSDFRLDFPPQLLR